MTKYDVAVVGATGAVGGTMLQVLLDRKFPAGRVRALASSRSAGTRIPFGDGTLEVEDVASADWRGVQVALFAGGEIASSEYAPAARDAGAVVIDNSATYRMDPEVPLVVPEVNPHHLEGHRGLVANPNCSTIQMVAALAPLHREVRLKRVVAATYQSVSGTGKDAIDELDVQVRCRVEGTEAPPPRAYPRRIAFNLLPHIASFADDGFTGEEHKMMAETRKILGEPDLPVVVTCVRVPVFYAHSEALFLEFEGPLSPDRAREILRDADGIRLMDDPKAGIYPTPLDAEFQDLVLVGRIRQDPSVEHGLALWVVADNLRKGAATNAVQIAETLIRDGRLAPRA